MEKGVLGPPEAGSDPPTPEQLLVPARARRFASPLVGREQQLGALRSAFASVQQNRACHLLTVLGPAGIGKSRLVEEFVSEVGAEATVLQRPLPPLRRRHHVLALDRDRAGDPAQRKARSGSESSSAAIAELLPGEEKAALIADLIFEALGLGSSGAGTGESTSWAVRRLFEALARRRPLVIVFDDLQWAEPTFLDLVDYLADLARDAPILLLVLGAARALRQPSALGRRAARRRLDAAGAAERRRLPRR